MARKTNVDELRIRSITTTPMPTGQTPIVSIGNNGMMTKDSRRIESEWQKHMTIIQATAIEEQYAENVVAFMLEHSTSVFKETAANILELKNGDNPDELQIYLDQFAKKSIEKLATLQLGFSDIAGTKIAYTLHRDHYPTELEEPGFLKKLFG